MTQLVLGALWSPEALSGRALALSLAVLLDHLFGDPRSSLHPVAWLGRFIGQAERAIRRLCGSAETAGGILLVAVTVLVTVGPALGLSVVLFHLYPPLAIAVEAVLVWLTLASRSLAHEGREVFALMEEADLPAARARVAGLVARRTEHLSESEVARAAVESLGENVVDAVIAPLFWAALLGAPGAWLHKAGSTLDSMAGYRSELYRRFGTASARLDDLLVWLPARLALLAVPLAAIRTGFAGRRSWVVGLRDRRKHASPNSAHGEALFSGALGVRLGGPVEYGEGIHDRALIGAEFPVPKGADIARAAELVTMTAALTAIGLAGALLVTAVLLGWSP